MVMVMPSFAPQLSAHYWVVNEGLNVLYRLAAIIHVSVPTTLHI